jgi:NAD(P)-dependent dehydrogenase (short-subunit alcohol dehydrogenase family)
MPNDRRRLDGKNTLVTGAARGIGLAVAERLAREGASVVLAEIDLEPTDEAASRLAAEGCGAVAARADVADPRSVGELAGFARDRFGALHVLVNNAAILDMTDIAGSRSTISSACSGPT